MESTKYYINAGYILRRCKTCHAINRLVLDRTLQARCGHCGHELLLSHYDVLSVPETASSEQIKTSYRQKVCHWHPDKRPQDSLASRRFQQIVDAYRILRDPEQRRQYNQTWLYKIHLQTTVPMKESNSLKYKPTETHSDDLRQTAGKASAASVGMKPVHRRTLLEYLASIGLILFGY